MGRLAEIASQLMILDAMESPEEQIDGVTYAEYFKNPLAYPGMGQKIMVRQYEANKKPHEFVEWQQGVLPSDTGDNSTWWPRYEATFKPLFDEGQYASGSGVAPNEIIGVLKQGEAAFRARVLSILSSPWGQGWARARGIDPANPF